MSKELEDYQKWDTLICFLLYPIHILLDAFTMSKLWQWFFTPFGLPQISMGWAFGLVLTAGFLNYVYDPERGAKLSKGFSKQELAHVIVALIVLFIGYITSHFFM